jgi:hypothetical protein
MAHRFACDVVSFVSSLPLSCCRSEQAACFRDSYQKYRDQQVWGGLKITLLDTRVWQKLSAEPEAYKAKYRRNIDLLSYDFVVMPMFGE